MKRYFCVGRRIAGYPYLVPCFYLNNAPEDAFPIAREQYEEVRRGDRKWMVQGKRVVEYHPPPEDLDDLRQLELIRIDQAAEKERAVGYRPGGGLKFRVDADMTCYLGRQLEIAKQRTDFVFTAWDTQGKEHTLGQAQAERLYVNLLEWQHQIERRRRQRRAERSGTVRAQQV